MKKFNYFFLKAAFLLALFTLSFFFLRQWFVVADDPNQMFCAFMNRHGEWLFEIVFVSLLLVGALIFFIWEMKKEWTEIDK